MAYLGIVAALIAEARSLTKEPLAVGELIHLPDGGRLQISGMGGDRARVAAQALLGNGVTALLSWGSAAGLIPDLLPGSVILPKTVIAADRTPDRILYPVDATWHERLSIRLRDHLNVHTGPLAESLTVVTTPDEKAALSSRTGAIAADMESGAVARVAYEAGVPFMVIRVVSDPFDLAIPACALAASDEFGQVRFSKLRKLALHPSELLTLARLGRNFRAARAALEKVARLVGTDLLVP